MNRSISVLLAAAWVMGFGVQADAGFSDFQFEVFRATVSLSYVTLEGGQLVNRRLTNRHVVNLGQGRDPEAPVPKNEILVVVNPDNYLFESAARFAIVDKDTNTIIKDLTQVEQSVSGYGVPDGSSFFLFAQGRLLEDLASANFTIGVASLSGTARGREKSSSKGTKLKTKVASLSGALPLTINGTPVPAVVLKGKVRVFGRSLFSFAP